jgi:predicted RNA-binding protein
MSPEPQVVDPSTAGSGHLSERLFHSEEEVDRLRDVIKDQNQKILVLQKENTSLIYDNIYLKHSQISSRSLTPTADFIVSSIAVTIVFISLLSFLGISLVDVHSWKICFAVTGMIIFHAFPSRAFRASEQNSDLDPLGRDITEARVSRLTRS